MVEPFSQADPIEQPAGPLFGFRRDAGAGERGDQDVFQHVALRQEVVVLEDEADVLIAEGGLFGLGQSERILSQE